MDILENLTVKNEKKILLVVLDGLGGLPRNGKTELESACTPNLDRLAAKSELGLLTPIEAGITPGSSAAVLALLGYDPLQHRVGRGLLDALGVGLDVGVGDLCCHVNLATTGPDGRVVDRRAGRVPTTLSEQLCICLQTAIPQIRDVAVTVRTVCEHHLVVVFRGPDLSDLVSDSDPISDGVMPRKVEALGPPAVRSAQLVNEFIQAASRVLGAEPSANFVLLRGFGQMPDVRSMPERFKLKPACVAAYPMYRGLAKLVGMEVLETGDTWESEVQTAHKHKSEYDFFLLHFKETDKAGEDGELEAKQELIEQFDEEILPQLLALKSDVLCITGDHSTPAVMGVHSWHPVPMLLSSPYVRPQVLVGEFGERTCACGDIGNLRSCRLMGLLLAHGLKLRRFGA